MNASAPEPSTLLSPAPMRICHLIEASGAGVGRHVLDLAGGLGGRGHHVHVIYSPVRAEPGFLHALHGLDVGRSELAIQHGVGPADLASAWRLRRLLRSLGPFDILHAHSSKAGGVLRLAPGTAGRIVYTPNALRSLDPTASRAARAVFGAAERLLALRTDAIILVSRDEYDHARSLGIPRRKLHAIFNGIPQPSMRPRAVVRAELGLADGAVVVGFVGRLSHQKAPEKFVAAAEQVMAAAPQVVAVMIGDGDQRALVEGCVGRSRFADRFRLLGARPGTDYIAGFDVMLMTSRYEAMSYVMLEALAARLPLVTTPVAGAADLVRPDGNGIIVGSHEVADIAAALGRVVADPALLARMGAGAADQDRAVNGERMVVETERLYRTLLGRR